MLQAKLQVARDSQQMHMPVKFPERSELGLSLRIRRDAAVCPDGRRISRYSSRRDRSILDVAPASGAGGVNNQLFARSQPTGN